eukprot:Nitzschia sp. Nitz4//scaffold52_size167869//72548//73822//NITZ4_002276-RA/size167869-processed-gene-0.163-mRNA-1//-1//CDS//3329554035//5137//frame0
MTVRLNEPQQPCGDSSSSEEKDARWPAHIAKELAGSIQTMVSDTIRQSRLSNTSSDIRLVDRSDILYTEKVLGSGAFSQVVSVICKDGRRYACKHLKKELMDKTDGFKLAISEMASEAHMMASFDHPNILRIRGWSRNGIASLEDGYHNSFFLLFDVLDETLETRIERWRLHEIAGVRDPSLYLQKIHTMTEIASAIEYLHSRGVIFRDLKPNNIGFINNRVQLFDFGLSRELPSLDTTIPFEMSGKVGTLRYMANEVAMHQPYNLSADVFSFAVVCYEMLSLQKPYDGWTRDMHTTLVCGRGMRPDTVNCLCPIPLEMRILLDHCWHADPASRPSISQVLVQLEVFREQQLQLLESQQRQLRVAQQLEAQRIVQEEAVARALQIELAYQLAPCAPHKPGSIGADSMETMDTAVLSADSIDLFY